MIIGLFGLNAKVEPASSQDQIPSFKMLSTDVLWLDEQANISRRGEGKLIYRGGGGGQSHHK